MKKKVLISLGIGVVAVILIVAITFLCIIYTANLDSTIAFGDKAYKVGDGETEFRVASYNVRGGYTTKEKLTKIREQIKDKGIDIAGIQEVDSDNAPRTSSVKDVSTLASDIYTHHIFAPTNSLFLGKNYGIMNIANREIAEAGISYLPMPSRMFMVRGEPRVCVRTIVNIDGTDIAFYNTHLSFENNVKMADGDEMRASQMKHILSLMNDDPCKYKVLVGDMNIMSFDEYKVFTDAGYHLMNSESNKLDSYRGDDVTLKALDNIIYSDTLELVEGGMIDNDLSDHNMLWARLRVVR